ncbi:MAG: tetratricopeptide repeat protein [Bacteroidota bacterium]
MKSTKTSAYIIKLGYCLFFYIAFIPLSKASEHRNIIDKLTKNWKSNPNSSYNSCDSILKTSKNLTSTETFELLNLQGKIDLGNFRFKFAFEKYSQALELIPQFDSSKQIKQKHRANIISNLGNIFAYQGLYSISLNNYTEAINIYYELNDINGQAVCLNNLGYVYETQKLYQKAKAYYWKAFFKNLLLKNKSGQAMNLANIGAIYEALNKYDSALLFNYKSVEISKSLNNILEVGACYNAIGTIYLKKGEYKKALEYFQSFLITKQCSENSYPLAITYQNIGGYYYKIHQIDSSLLYYSRALKISSDIKAYTLIFDNAENLVKCYAEKQLFEKAYNTELIANIAKDTLNQQHTLQEISKQELKYSFELKQKENEYAQRRKEFKFWGFIILLVGLITITILLIIRQRLIIFNKNLEEQNLLLENNVLQKEVEIKSKELTTNSLYLAKKNEILSQLEKQLQNVNKQSTNEAEKKFRIHEMINTVKSNTDENAWKDFEVRFNEVHTNFYENILKIYPKLSLNEKRLCAFLRLNMTTKEISSLTQQTPHSINIARFRLRKKLGLKPEESLETFLSNF